MSRNTRNERNLKDKEARSADDEFLPPDRWQKRGPGFFGKLMRVLVMLAVLALLVLPFTPYAGKIKRALNDLVDKARSSKVVYRDKEVTVTKEVPRDVTREVIKEVVKEVPAPPPPLPSKFIPRKEVDVATLYNGITIQTQLESAEGTFASVERKDKDAFTVEFKLKLRVPKANDSLPELAKVNTHLPTMLPGLESMVKNGKISGFYHKLYDRKTSMVQQNLTRLNKVLDRHNFFDTETILELTHPTSNRRALLIQSDMDVVADGSDGDRMPNMDAAIYQSAYYQPSTSYEWAKKGKTTNPLLPLWQKRVDEAKKAFAVKGLSNARNAELKAEIQHGERVITGLKTRSSLIAEKDPFIVLSLLFRDYPKTHPHAPGMGDYAAVIHEDKIYPAICGDYGPSFKMGEASLLMAKTINEKATPYIRPESDLKVTYIIFPGTAERPFGPPNLEHWHQQVSAYLEECGGIGTGYTLHKWENPFPPPPEPEPTPDPAAPVPVGSIPAVTDSTDIAAPATEVKPAEPAAETTPPASDNSSAGETPTPAAATN